MSAASDRSAFSISQARGLVADLFDHRAWIYWADMLVTITIGYGAAAVYLNSPLWSLQQIAAYLVAGFALFRVGSYIHEIVHFHGREMRGFLIGWNILAGIPMMMPSFFYGNHLDHHKSPHYGTGLDGEYLPLGNGPLRNVLYFFGQVLLLPAAVFLRFLLLTPLSLLDPRLRKWTLERASSFVINLRYRQVIPPHAPRKVWAVLELAICLRAWGMLGFVALGFAPVSRIVAIYALALMVLGLNYVRNLVAHHYRSDGESMSHAEQLADSVNITGLPVLTELFFPLNLRYHALHHLFPALPYHNLARAHRRLMADLPADSPYRDTVYPSYWTVVAELVRDATRPAARDTAAAWHHNRLKQLAERKVRTDLPPEDNPRAAGINRPGAPAATRPPLAGV